MAFWGEWTKRGRSPVIYEVYSENELPDNVLSTKTDHGGTLHPPLNVKTSAPFTALENILFLLRVDLVQQIWNIWFVIFQLWNDPAKACFALSLYDLTVLTTVPASKDYAKIPFKMTTHSFGLLVANGKPIQNFIKSIKYKKYKVIKAFHHFSCIWYFHSCKIATL